jgi:hypothetical protein
MSDNNYEVALAAYATKDQANKDFEALVKLVEDEKVTTAEYVLLVVHDNDGEVHITDAYDHLGRKGFIGRLVENRVDSGIEAKVGDNLPMGSAAVIAMVEAADSAATNLALAGSMAIATSQVAVKGVNGLKQGLEDAAKPGSMQAPKAKQTSYHMPRNTGSGTLR